MRLTVLCPNCAKEIETPDAHIFIPVSRVDHYTCTRADWPTLYAESQRQLQVLQPDRLRAAESCGAALRWYLKVVINREKSLQWMIDEARRLDDLHLDVGRDLLESHARELAAKDSRINEWEKWERIRASASKDIQRQRDEAMRELAEERAKAERLEGYRANAVHRMGMAERERDEERAKTATLEEIILDKPDIGGRHAVIFFYDKLKQERRRVESEAALSDQLVDTILFAKNFGPHGDWSANGVADQMEAAVKAHAEHRRAAPPPPPVTGEIAGHSAWCAKQAGDPVCTCATHPLTPEPTGDLCRHRRQADRCLPCAAARIAATTAKESK